MKWWCWGCLLFFTRRNIILVFMVSLSYSLGHTLSLFYTFAIYSLDWQFTLHPSSLYLQYFRYCSSLPSFFSAQCRHSLTHHWWVGYSLWISSVSLSQFFYQPMPKQLCTASCVFILKASAIRLGLYSSPLYHYAIIKYFVISE